MKITGQAYPLFNETHDQMRPLYNINRMFVKIHAFAVFLSAGTSWQRQNTVFPAIPILNLFIRNKHSMSSIANSRNQITKTAMISAGKLGRSGI
jgi:hypothetical protein